MKNYFQLLLLLFVTNLAYTQTTFKAQQKIVIKNNFSQPLPHSVFFQLIDSTESFIINQQTEFKHIDVPKKFCNQFTAYIKDSVAMEVKGLKSLVYYNYKLTNGKYINGDIYWSNTNSYIVFEIEGKKYVNYFTKDGVQQLKNLFKL